MKYMVDKTVFPHTLRIMKKDCVDYNPGKFSIIYGDWLRSNVGYGYVDLFGRGIQPFHIWMIRFVKEECRIQFKSKKDAMKFKLAWQGKELIFN